MGPLSFEDDEEALATGADEMLAGEDLTVGALGASGISAAYEAAIKRLLAQRSGLSSRERLGAALVGFGQPSRHGWRGGVANASQMLLQQAMQARKQDEERRAQLEKLMLGRDVASAKDATALKVAEIRANKPPKLANDTDQRMRLGYAKRLFPNLSEDEIVKRNLLYDPRVDQQMFRVYGARSAAMAGEEIPEVVPEEAADVPTITTPEEGAQYPDAPVVNTPRGTMRNPYFKGG